MESNTFKSVAFGGFDKQDVISYIERTSGEFTAATEKLQRENDSIRAENAALTEQVSTWKAQAKEQTAALQKLRADFDAAAAQNRELCGLRSEVERLTAEAETLRPEAEAYRKFRNRIGDIECEARKRAADLESAVNARLGKLVSDFYGKYENLVTAFDAASGYATGELRKVEVNLTQLPRALDQVGSELKELDADLKKTKQQ